VAAGNKSLAGPPQTCLLQSLGWYRSICRILCQHEGDSSGHETSIAHTSFKCGSDYRGHPARPAPNNKRNRDYGVASQGLCPTGTAMAPGNKSSAGPPHLQLRRVLLAGTNAGFNLLLPPPLGGAVPDPPIASAVSMFSMPLL
jgi:hypothetical protein